MNGDEAMHMHTAPTILVYENCRNCFCIAQRLFLWCDHRYKKGNGLQTADCELLQKHSQLLYSIPLCELAGYLLFILIALALVFNAVYLVSQVLILFKLILLEKKVSVSFKEQKNYKAVVMKNSQRTPSISTLFICTDYMIICVLYRT